MTRMVSSRQLRERMAKAIARARDIINTADDEGRERTAAEDAEIRRLHEQARQAQRQLPAAELEEMAQHQNGPPFWLASGNHLPPEQTHYLDAQGRKVPVLNYTESFGEAVLDTSSRSPDAANVGELLAAWIGAAETPARRQALRNFQSEGNPVAGGYLLSSAMSARVIDLARAKSVVVKGGGKTVPMNSAELTIAKVDSDPTSY